MFDAVPANEVIIYYYPEKERYALFINANFIGVYDSRDEAEAESQRKVV